MKASHWMDNGETIKFSIDGKLIDGQHRLTASIEAGVGFWSLIAYGLPTDAFITIDRGQPRSIGQQLHLAYGLSDYNNAQAALTWLYRFRDGIVVQDLRPTVNELAELLEDNPGVVDSVKAAAWVHNRLRTPSKSTTAFVHYCFTRQDATLAEAFFEALATGASLREKDPVFRLRERLISHTAMASKRLTSYEFIALCFKAWTAEKEKRTIDGSLRWQVGESFPNIGMIGVKKRRPEQITALPVNVRIPKKRFGKKGKPHGEGNANDEGTQRKNSKIAKLLKKPLSLDRVAASR